MGTYPEQAVEDIVAGLDYTEMKNHQRGTGQDDVPSLSPDDVTVIDTGGRTMVQLDCNDPLLRSKFHNRLKNALADAETPATLTALDTNEYLVATAPNAAQTPGRPQQY